MAEIQSQNMKVSGEGVKPRNRSSHGSFVRFDPFYFFCREVEMPSFALSLASQISLLVQNLSVSNQNSVLYELSLVRFSRFFLDSERDILSKLQDLGMCMNRKLAERVSD